MSLTWQAFPPCYKDLPRFVLDHGTYDENKPVLIDAAAPERAITKAQAKAMVEQTARGLQAIGLQQGDTVCVVHFNDYMYPVVFLAIIMAGGVFSGVNPMYKVGELRHHFEVSEAKFVFSDFASFAAVSEASEGLLDAANIIIWDDEELAARAGTRHSLASIMAASSASPGDLVSFDDETRAATTVAVLMSTSGTTGLPKMAARSHLSLVTENMAIQDGVAKTYKVARLLFTPFFHGFTAPLALVDALVSGHTTYVMPRFSLPKCLEYVERFGITEMAAPLPVLSAFRLHPEQQRTALRSVHTIWSGGAPMSREMQNTAVKMFHPFARIVQVYGMTETGWITTFKYPEIDETGSVGRLLPTYRLQIRIHEGIDTRPGEGLLWIYGPINMLHYHNNIPATTCTLQENWLCTGDIAHFSPDHKLYITSRHKDMIKFHGWQVSPTELEACLLTHPLVADAGVFGFIIDDDTAGEEAPIAHVVLRSGIPAFSAQFRIMQELRQHCFDRLSKYKVIALSFRFKHEIPKNAAGKILRLDMVEQEEMFRKVTRWLDRSFGCEPDWPLEEDNVVWEDAEGDAAPDAEEETLLVFGDDDGEDAELAALMRDFDV